MLCFTPVNFQKLIPAKYLYTSSMQQLAKNILFDTSRIFLKSIFLNFHRHIAPTCIDFEHEIL